MSTFNKAWLDYYDAHNFGRESNETVKTARLAFMAGYEAAQQYVQRTCPICGGRKVIRVASGEMQECDECGGNGTSR